MYMTPQQRNGVPTSSLDNRRLLALGDIETQSGFINDSLLDPLLGPLGRRLSSRPAPGTPKLAHAVPPRDGRLWLTPAPVFSILRGLGDADSPLYQIYDAEGEVIGTTDDIEEGTYAPSSGDSSDAVKQAPAGAYVKAQSSSTSGGSSIWGSVVKDVFAPAVKAWTPVAAAAVTKVVLGTNATFVTDPKTGLPVISSTTGLPILANGTTNAGAAAKLPTWLPIALGAVVLVLLLKK